MYLSQAALARLWLWAFLTGAALGAVYDCLRLSRLLPGGVPPIGLRDRRLPLLGHLPPVKKRRIAAVPIFFEDLLFGILAGTAMTVLFYEAFDGKIRVPALFVAAAGFGLFRVTLGRLTERAAALIGLLLEVAVRYALFFAALPVRCAVGLLGRAHRAAQRRARARYTEQVQREVQKAEEREKHGKDQKETVQPEPDGADLPRRPRDRVDRGVHRKRHAVQ